MFWAKVDNKKVKATPDTYGKCPHCGNQVFSKCGDVKTWHWSHFEGKNCDPRYEPESYWHLHWKMTFGADYSEIKIEKNGKWHVADILTNNDVVIELQNSPIKKPTIREREDFYGERMIWLINGIHFKHKFIIHDWIDTQDGWRIRDNHNINTGRKKLFKWRYTHRSWLGAKRNIFIDFNEETLFWVKEGMGRSLGFGKFVTKEDFIRKYGGNYEYYCQKNLNNNE